MKVLIPKVFVLHLLWARVFFILDFITDLFIWLLSVLSVPAQFNLMIRLRVALQL